MQSVTARLSLSALARPEPVVQIVLPGSPRGKGRPRFRIAYSRGRAFPIAYTDSNTRAYEAALAAKASKQMGELPPFDCPLAVDVQAIFQPPQSWSGIKRQNAIGGLIRPTTKPDADNILKVMDALTGIVWRDDSLVVSSTVEKWYGDSPRLQISVWTWSHSLC